MTESHKDKPGELTFRYAESPLHRTVLCSGAIGGVLPSGDISLSVFTERGPLPQQTTETLDASGVTTGEVAAKRIPQGPIPATREVQFTAILDIAGARRLAEWLVSNAAKAEAAKKGAN